MVFTVHGGHAAQGNKYSGASGYCSESYVDREVKNALITILRNNGQTVYDCTVDKGTSQGNIITQIKRKINAVKGATCNISIHLNACKKRAKDGRTTGVECIVYSLGNKGPAQKICDEIAKLGYTNRGVKANTSLGVLKGITNGGQNVLVECFFCDDEDDYLVYKKVGAYAIAQAIANGLFAQYGISGGSKAPATTGKYIKNGVDYGYVFDPVYYGANNPDVAKAFNNNAKNMFNHFLTYGMKEGRLASANFNVHTYRSRYADLQNAFGSNLPEYYKHYCQYGRLEGRNAI